RPSTPLLPYTTLFRSLAAPVTRQSWRLSVDAGGARLEGMEGGTRTGPDGQQLLLEATGLDVPVGALGAWLRGLPADEAEHGPARDRKSTRLNSSHVKI